MYHSNPSKSDKRAPSREDRTFSATRHDQLQNKDSGEVFHVPNTGVRSSSNMSAPARITLIVAVAAISLPLLCTSMVSVVVTQPRPQDWSSQTIGVTSSVCGKWTTFTASGVIAGSSRLVSVATISENDIWAVGNTSNVLGATRALIVHWDGTHWNPISAPELGSEDSTLTGVGAISSRDVWAVGSLGDNILVLHWDGSRWTHDESATGSASNTRYMLNAIVAISNNDIWAVGSYGQIGSATIDYSLLSEKTLALHWDGVRWSVVPSPNVSTRTNRLTSVAGNSPSDAWAVGYHDAATGRKPLALHWDGATWKQVRTPDGRTSDGDNKMSHLDGIAAPDPKHLWAVGGVASYESSTKLVLSGDGSKWTLTPASSPSDLTALTAVAGRNINDVWAVGMQGKYETGHTLVEHWDGTDWNIVPGPNTLGNQGLWSVAVLPSGEVWAVGHAGAHALIARFARDSCSDPSQ